MSLKTKGAVAMQTISLPAWELSVDIGKFLSQEEIEVNDETVEKVEQFIRRALDVKNELIVQPPLQNLANKMKQLGQDDLSYRVTALIEKREKTSDS